MNNKILFSLVLLLALLGGAGLLHLQSKLENRERISNEVNAKLLKIEKVNSSLNELALKSRSNLDSNYDDLVNATQLLSSIVDSLSETHFSEDKIAGTLLEEQFNQFKNAIEVKVDHIENFKAHNSVLRNSDKFIPLVGRQLIDIAEQSNLYANASLYENVIIDTLLFSKQDSDMSPNQIANFSEDITDTEESMPPGSLSRLIEFSNHVATIANSKEQADAYLNQALNSAAGIQVEAIQEAWGAFQEETNTQQKALMNYSIAYVILMMLLFGWLTNRLRGVYNGLDKEVKLKTDQVKTAYESLRQSEKRLSQNEKMASLGQLISGVAHQVNTPLAFASSNVGLVKSKITNLIPVYQSVRDISETVLSKNYTNKSISALLKQQIAEFNKVKGTNPDDLITLLEDSSEGLNDIKGTVETLTSYSNVESSDKVEVDINQCVKNALSLFEERIGAREIKYEFMEESLIVNALLKELIQMLSNIIDNAIDATTNTGEITIKTSSERGGAKIIITDDGSGIDSKVLSKVCDPFYTTKEIDEGKGLGLSIAQQIVAAHNGELLITSEKSKGTQVTIFLPKYG